MNLKDFVDRIPIKMKSKKGFVLIVSIDIYEKEKINFVKNKYLGLNIITSKLVDKGFMMFGQLYI